MDVVVFPRRLSDDDRKSYLNKHNELLYDPELHGRSFDFWEEGMLSRPLW